MGPRMSGRSDRPVPALLGRPGRREGDSAGRASPVRRGFGLGQDCRTPRTVGLHFSSDHLICSLADCRTWGGAGGGEEAGEARTAPPAARRPGPPAALRVPVTRWQQRVSAGLEEAGRGRRGGPRVRLSAARPCSLQRPPPRAPRVPAPVPAGACVRTPRPRRGPGSANQRGRV